MTSQASPAAAGPTVFAGMLDYRHSNKIPGFGKDASSKSTCVKRTDGAYRFHVFFFRHCQPVANDRRLRPILRMGAPPLRRAPKPVTPPWPSWAWVPVA